MRPNFFIVGAPKCGTTALSQYLGEHQQIFISSPKEPHFFATDFLGFRPYYIQTIDAYCKLFADASEKHLAIGEASVWYLFSSVAIKNLYQFNPDSKIIVLLRNPIEMVYSQHSQFVFSMVEDVRDFEEAWHLQEARSVGKNIPKNVPIKDRSQELLQYGKIGKFGEQIERLMSIFPSNQVKVFLLDDFRASTKDLYNEVLAFLNVPIDGRTVFQPINENKIHKSPLIAKLAKDTPQTIIHFANRFGLKNTGVLQFINRLNTKKVKRKPLNPRFKQELSEFFAEDVNLLSKLINRNLDHWL